MPAIRAQPRCQEHFAAMGRSYGNTYKSLTPWPSASFLVSLALSQRRWVSFLPRANSKGMEASKPRTVKGAETANTAGLT